MISCRLLENSEFEIAKKIRMQVFVIEQQIPEELEYDEKDEGAYHFIAEVNGIPAGYCRVYDFNGIGKIGRVAVLKDFRKRGIASMLIKYAEDSLSMFKSWLLHSQTYIVPLYEKCGYTRVGNEFIEDGIQHYKMVKPLY